MTHHAVIGHTGSGSIRCGCGRTFKAAKGWALHVVAEGEVPAARLEPIGRARRGRRRRRG